MRKIDSLLGQTQYKHRAVFAVWGTLGRVEERDFQLQAFFCCSVQMQPQKVTAAHLILDLSVSEWEI